MGDALDQMLLGLGVDMTAAQAAKDTFKTLMEDLNRITAAVEGNAINAAKAQQGGLDAIKSTADSAVKAALAAIEGAKQLQAETAKQTAELKSQLVQSQARVGVVETEIKLSAQKYSALSAETAELRKQEEAQARIGAQLREQIVELRKRKAEGGEGRGVEGKEKGFAGNIVSELLGGSTGGKIAGALFTGAGIGAVVESATEGIAKFIDKLKEGTIEASKLTQAMDLFEKSTAAHNLDPKEFMGSLQEATEGLVNKLDLAVLGARALNSGIKSLTPEKVIQLTEAVTILAEKNNKSAKEAVQAITSLFTRGAERGTQMVAAVTGLPQTLLRVSQFAPDLNRAQRSAEALNHLLPLIVAQAAQLGTAPATLEQALVRLKVVYEDMFQSFGKGINESGGMQALFSLLKGGAKSLTDMEDKAEDFGKTFGDALGAVFAIASQLFTVVKSLGTSFLEVAGGLNDMLFKDTPDPESPLAQIQALHPVMTEVVRLATAFSIIMEQTADAVHKVADNFKLIFRNAGIGAIVGAIAGGIIGGPGGIAAGAAMGARVAAGTTALGIGTNVLPLHDNADTSYSSRVMDAIGVPGALSVGTQAAKLFTTPTPPAHTSPTRVPISNQLGAGSTPAPAPDANVLFGGRTVEEELKRRMNEWAETMRPSTDKKGSYNTPELDETNRAVAEKNAAAEEAYQQARAARIKADTDSEAKTRLDNIETAKEQEDAAYKASEVDLTTHLNRMKDLENESFQAHKDIATASATKQLGDLVAQRADILAKNAAGAYSDPKQFTLALQANDEKQQTAVVEGNAALEDLARAHGKTMADLVAQGVANQVAALKTGIQERLALVTEAAQTELQVREKQNKASQELNKSQLGEGTISPEDYFRKQIALVNELRDARVAAATAEASAKIKSTKDTLALTPQNADAQAAAQKAIAIAQGALARGSAGAVQDAIDALQNLAQTHTQVGLGAMQKQYGPQVSDLEHQLQMAQQYPQYGASQTGPVQNILDILRTWQSKLGVQLTSPETLREGPNAVQSVTTALQTVNDQLLKYSQQLLQLMDLTQHLGTIFQALGDATQLFGSKYMQSVSRALTSGAKELLGSTALGQVLGAPTPQSGYSGAGVVPSDSTGSVGDDGLPIYQGSASSRSGIQGTPTSTTNDVITSFATKLNAAVSAVSGFVDTILHARNAVAGGIGGAVAGAGAGNSLGTAAGSMFSSLGAMGGPIGMAAGASVGAILGIITGKKNQQVTNEINSLNIQFQQMNNQFAENTNNLALLIQQMQALFESASSLANSSKKGSAQFAQLAQQYSQQLVQLQAQQATTIRNMNEQIAILTEPIGAQQYLSSLQQILQQYQQMEGAASSATDLANANQFLTLSLQQYTTTLSQQLLQDNVTAIQQAIQLNDLQYQRSQMMLQYNQQVQQVLGQGVLTRQMTRAQTAGQQIEQMSITYAQQLENINEQISADQYSVNAASQIFNLAQTRVGLEYQLLTAQNAQTTYSMTQIAALSALITQMTTANYGSGPLGALLAAFQTVTNPAAGQNPATPGITNPTIGQVLSGLSGATVTPTASQSATQMAAALAGLSAQGPGGAALAAAVAAVLSGLSGVTPGTSGSDAAETMMANAYQQYMQYGYGNFRGANVLP